MRKPQVWQYQAGLGLVVSSAWKPLSASQSGAGGVFAIGRVSLAPDVLQARLVIRELADELKQVAGRFRRRCTDRVSAVNWGTRLLLVGKNASWAATRGAFAFSLISGHFTPTT